MDTQSATLNPSGPVHLRNLYQNKNLNSYCRASKGFMKAFKTFLKSLRHQRSVKNKI